MKTRGLIINFLALIIVLLSTISCKKDVPGVALTLPDDLGLVINNTTNAVQANWNEVAGATSYTVELSNDLSEVIFVNQTLEPAMRFSGLSSGQVYSLRIKANVGNPQFDSPYSAYLPIAMKLAPPVPVLSKASSNSLSFTWPEQASAINYFVELKTEGDVLVSEAQTTSASYEFTGLVENVRYKFRVRSKSERSESDYSADLMAITTKRSEGFPVSWVFAETNQQKDYLNRALDPVVLQSLQPRWATHGELKSENINGYNATAVLSIVSNSGSANGFAYNNGHPYLRGLMNNDYWLFTIPVKNFKANTTITLHTNVTGSGSGPGPFIIEWSTDKSAWISAGAKTETIVNGSKNETVTYTYHQGDNLNATGQPITQDMLITNAIEDGNIYIRLRVAADIRVAKNGTAISTTGSLRLMSRQLIVIKD